MLVSGRLSPEIWCHLTTCRTRIRVCRVALREETTRCSQCKTAGAEMDQLERAKPSITNVLSQNLGASLN